MSGLVVAAAVVIVVVESLQQQLRQIVPFLFYVSARPPALFNN